MYSMMLNLLFCLVIILVSIVSLQSFHQYVKSTSISQNTSNNIDVETHKDSKEILSPSFPIQESIDPKLDWINMRTREFTNDGDRSTDIESIDYYSDGKTLNATLWLYFPFKPTPSPSYENVNYGMFINSDFNEDTGFGGIDYKVEISWNNQNKNWTKLVEKWSHFGEVIVLDNKTIPYTDFASREGTGGHYVLLTADLDALLSPKKYKVVFYGEVKKQDDGIFRTDFTRMVAIPPLELSISTSPNSVELRKGETKTIEVKVSTAQGYEPIVNLSATSHSDDIFLDFTQNNKSPVPSSELRIPSYGVATVPLTITSAEDAAIGPKTLFIFANSSFPPEELITARTSEQDNLSSTHFLPSSVRPVENIFTDSTLLLTLQEPLTYVDHIGEFWSKVGAPISFVTGILAGSIPWIFTRFKKIRKRSNVPI
jgi:hypothetical protein